MTYARVFHDFNSPLDDDGTTSCFIKIGDTLEIGDTCEGTDATVESARVGPLRDGLEDDYVVLTMRPVPGSPWRYWDKAEQEQLDFWVDLRNKTKEALANAMYFLNPNQGEPADPSLALQWLRTTLHTSHPNYIDPKTLEPGAGSEKDYW